tara:strand:+ start:630 stop:2324 length:1695 start_codon:yes stop_codon:yes gene_type:complete
MTNPRQYNLTEGTDQLILSHATKAGSHYTGAVYFNGTKLDDSTDQIPAIIYGTEDTSQRLTVSEVQTATSGTKMMLPNMRGRSLDDINFDSQQTVVLGQIINVGFRTTDVVQHLFKGTYNSINAFEIGFVLAGPRAGNNTYYKGGDIARHSTKFISQNFQGVNMLAALKYVGRYDKHILIHDRFGNLLYTPDVFAYTDREVGDAKGIAEVKVRPLVGSANQITVRGRPMALNDNNIINVDDMDSQKRDGAVKNQRIDDPLSKTKVQARLTASQMLRFNRKAQSILDTRGHMNSWDLDPGDIVNYKTPSSGIDKSVALLKAEHSLRKHSSDFRLVRDDDTLEGMLAAFSSTGTIENDEADFISQIQTHELSNLGDIQLRVQPSIITHTLLGTQARVYSHITASDNPYAFSEPMGAIDPATYAREINNDMPNKHAGLIIGHRYSQGNTTNGIGTTDVTKAARGAIGVGASLSTTVSAYTHVGTTITVASTDGFPTSGALMVTSEESTKSMYLTYTGITDATTFEGVARTPTALTGDVSFSPHAKVIYARPRSHEVGTHRSKMQVVL